jgi:hypothetical protein
MFVASLDFKHSIEKSECGSSVLWCAGFGEAAPFQFLGASNPVPGLLKSFNGPVKGVAVCSLGLHLRAEPCGRETNRPTCRRSVDEVIV